MKILSFASSLLKQSDLLRVVRPITQPCIIGCHGACNLESIAAIVFCITGVRAQTDILHKNDSSTFSTGGMVRRQNFDLFVDKSLQ